MEPIQTRKTAELGKRTELGVQQSDNGANSGQRRRQAARPLGPFPYSSLNEDMDNYAKIAVLFFVKGESEFISKRKVRFVV